MDVNRRDVLKVLIGGTAMTAVAASTAHVAKAESDTVQPLEDAVGLLDGATKCIGGRACMPACQNANGLVPDRGLSHGLYMQPNNLNSQTKNLIKLYVAEDGHESSFIKQQGMNWGDPAC